MAWWHLFLRAPFALLVTFITSIFLSVGTIYIMQTIAEFVKAVVVWAATQLARLWRFILFLALTIFFTSILFWYVMSADEELDRGIDALIVAVRAGIRVATSDLHWPAFGEICVNTVPTAFTHYCMQASQCM